MPNFQPVSKTTHAQKRWLRATSYAFAREHGMLPLGLPELSRAVTSVPLAFVPQGEGFQPVALMSIRPDRNLYVLPNGQWLPGYIPAFARVYPFRLLKAADGRQIVCIDQDAGLISDGPEGEPFFDEAGEPAPAFKEVLEVLNQLEQGVKQATAAAGLLQRHGLIKPWALKVQSDDGEKLLGGLFQTDEEALNRVPAEALVELRNSGALIQAYCQLISMQHVQVLGQLAVAHAKAEKASAEAAARTVDAKGDLNLEFLKSNDSLNFGAFR